MTKPDMTAHWESQLEAISEKKIKYGQFMQPMVDGQHVFIHQVDNIRFDGLRGLGA
jgi:DNA topoisomerase-3